MATAGSWRAGLFKPGVRYEVLKECSFPGDYFTKGEILTYESCGYERYDSETLYRFVREGASQKNASPVWHLRDDQPDTLVNECFRELRP